MRLEQGFAGKTRIQKIAGKGKGKKGLVVDVNYQSGTWNVRWENKPDEIDVAVSPDECDYWPEASHE